MVHLLINTSSKSDLWRWHTLPCHCTLGCCALRFWWWCHCLLLFFFFIVRLRCAVERMLMANRWAWRWRVCAVAIVVHVWSVRSGFRKGAGGKLLPPLECWMRVCECALRKKHLCWKSVAVELGLWIRKRMWVCEESSSGGSVSVEREWEWEEKGVRVRGERVRVKSALVLYKKIFMCGHETRDHPCRCFSLPPFFFFAHLFLFVCLRCLFVLFDCLLVKWSGPTALAIVHDRMVRHHKQQNTSAHPISIPTRKKKKKKKRP